MVFGFGQWVKSQIRLESDNKEDVVDIIDKFIVLECFEWRASRLHKIDRCGRQEDVATWLDIRLVQSDKQDDK